MTSSSAAKPAIPRIFPNIYQSTLKKKSFFPAGSSMKKILLISVLAFITIISFAQGPVRTMEEIICPSEPGKIGNDSRLRGIPRKIE